jgi:hypothetical protein
MTKLDPQLEEIRALTEKLCSSEHIPLELKNEFNTCWEMVHFALIHLQEKINNYEGY